MRYPIFLILFLSSYVAQTQAFRYLPTTDYRYIATTQLLRKLHKAAGDSLHLPHLAIEKKGVNPPQNAPVAYYNAFLEEIVIEEEILDLCHNFRQDSTAALAFVLGHELAHYHLGHSSSNFCAFHSENVEKIDTLLLQNEILADKIGNFYARLAGYSPCDLGQKLIHQIYQQFSIPASPNYLNIENRIALLEQNCHTADTLAHLFMVAKQLSQARQYEPSITLFHHVLAQFPSKEMYFNAAIVCLQWVVNEGFDPSDSLYQMPLLFKEKVHFRQGMSPTAMRLQFKKREMYLKESKQYLKMALDIDKNYPLANLYLPYITYLQGKIPGNLVEDLLVAPLNDSLFSAYEKNNYLILQGIQSVLDGKRARARAFFAAIPPNWESIHYNMCLLEKKPLPEKTQENAPIKMPDIWQTAEKKELFQQHEMKIEMILQGEKLYYHFKNKGGDWYF